MFKNLKGGEDKMKEQFVCTVCGFNIIGHYPANCPFCGAPQEKYITAEECSRRYHVQSTKVNNKVSQLLSNPRLGYEHASYRIKSDDKTFLIDCPSCFDQSLEPFDTITFTHHHFLSASNLYRTYFHSEVLINRLDTENELAERFSFDNKFSGDFSDSGLEAYHINGHTSGFTIYVYEDILFICDYVFLMQNHMKFNPYGPQSKTREGAKRIAEIAKTKNISVVCGVSYVEEYSQWCKKFEKLMGKSLTEL